MISNSKPIHMSTRTACQERAHDWATHAVQTRLPILRNNEIVLSKSSGRLLHQCKDALLVAVVLCCTYILLQWECSVQAWPTVCLHVGRLVDTYFCTVAYIYACTYVCTTACHITITKKCLSQNFLGPKNWYIGIYIIRLHYTYSYTNTQQDLSSGPKMAPPLHRCLARPGLAGAEANGMACRGGNTCWGCIMCMLYIYVWYINTYINIW